ncbi:MAG: PKD-like domain-containing protein [Rikenellaceae bacterium]
MKKAIFLIFTIFAVVSQSACQSDTSTDNIPAPTITLDSSTDIYTTTQGGAITITPTYQNVEGATYAWSLDGVVISSYPELTFLSSVVGDYYIVLSVARDSYTVYKELKIEVLSPDIPSIQFIEGESLYVVVGNEFTISPIVVGGSSYSWSIDGVEISTSDELIYSFDSVGIYEVTLGVSNDHGTTYSTLIVNVVESEDMPFSWSFERVNYNISSGRQIRLKCWNVTSEIEGDLVWSIEGEELQRGSSEEYIFDKEQVGVYIITLCKLDSSDNIIASQDFEVNVCDVEGTFKRPTSGNAQCNKVYEFTPAPGQYINEGYDCSTMEEACDYAFSRLEAGSYVSLGAWGGSIVVGFDHSVECSGDYDIMIQGNATSTSSEPAIVMVMQDENGDGLPNDTWYELAGGESLFTSDYCITYYKPTTSSSSVAWLDNFGGSGSVSYNNFHNQSSYYPAWIAEDQLTIYGTRLESKAYQTDSGIWVNPPFEWGYADNYYNSESVNYFRISDAVNWRNESVALEYIDFVKIYTAVNDQVGMMGEVSSEIISISAFF